MNRKDMFPEKNFSIELTDASDLMEKQSVRATFRLSAEFIEALRALSAQLGIKQKSLFDHLMEDRESLRAIAGRVRPDQLDKNTRVQKTFVISKRSLSSLDAVSKNSEASRDDLVEYSIQRLLPILMEERQKQNKREQALGKIASHYEQTTQVLDRLMDMIGKDDPIYKAMNAVVHSYGEVLEKIENMVNSGKKISDLPMEKFQR